MTEFRKSMKETMDIVSENDETLIVSRSGDRDIVVLSLQSYNSMQETLYQMSSGKNRMRLEQAIKDVEKDENVVNNALLHD